jgi:hypothetical protein
MANTLRSALQTRAAALALRVCQKYGDQITYTSGSGSTATIYAIGKDRFLKTNGPDEEAITWTIPYQTNFTSAPASGATITLGSEKWIIDTVSPDDGEFPSTWECQCMRWLHASPEVQ